MNVIDYLKLVSRRDIVNIFVGILCAYCGISLAFTNFKFDRWTMKSFEGMVTSNPVRSGRSGLVVTVSSLDSKSNARDMNIYFNEAGYPHHPLNDLRTGDKVYIEALFHPTRGYLDRAMGVHLVCNARTLFSKDHYFKKHREGNFWVVLFAIAPLCWLLYQLNKHYFHYRYLKNKRRYNVGLPT